MLGSIGKQSGESVALASFFKFTTWRKIKSKKKKNVFKNEIRNACKKRQMSGSVESVLRYRSVISETAILQ